MFAMLVLAAPKRVPTECGFVALQGGLADSTFCGPLPDDANTAPIIEEPSPAPGQMPVLPAGVLLIGITGGGALVVMAARRVRRRPALR